MRDMCLLGNFLVASKVPEVGKFSIYEIVA